eukprot:COSAG06_NODE_2988_length_5984_cov_63.200170_3_plen_133_part_00
MPLPHLHGRHSLYDDARWHDRVRRNWLLLARRVENVARARDDAIADLTDIRRRMRSARTPGGHTDPDLCADEIADASGEMIADLADGRRTDAEVSANADIGGGVTQRRLFRFLLMIPAQTYRLLQPWRMTTT